VSEFPEHVRSKTPCCGRAVSFDFMRSATLTYARKCRACGQRWKVVVVPVKVEVGRSFHRATWAQEKPKREAMGCISDWRGHD